MWGLRKADRQKREPIAPRATRNAEPAARRGLDWAALLPYAAPAEQTRRDYSLPKPPPGTIPQGGMAMDDCFGGINQWAAGQQFVGLDAIGPMFPGYTVLAELVQRPEYRRPSELFAQEMTRKWIKLTKHGDDDTDKVKAISEELVRFKVRDAFRNALMHDGIFGRGHIFIDVGAQGDELTKPLLLKSAKIAQGSLQSIRAIEPMWCYPAGYNSTSPLKPDFYKPTIWYVQGQAIHASRLRTMVGREVSDILKPAYMFGGLSRTMLVHEVAENYRRTRRSVSDLVKSFSTMVLKTPMESTGLSGAFGGLVSRIQAFIQFRDNRGAFVIDKDSEDFANVSVPLGGLDALQAQAQEQQASVVHAPLVKLTGITPSGLNASSDGEIRVFYDEVHAEQEDTVRDDLKVVIDVIQLNKFGEIDPTIGFEFVSLWQLNETEQATVEKIRADTDAVLIESGELLPEEGRQRIASDDASPYHGLDMSVELPEPAPDPADDPEMAEALRGSDPHTEHAAEAS